MSETANNIPPNAVEIVGLFYFTLIISIVAIIFAMFKFLSMIELRLKIRKIKKISTKHNLTDYVMKTNSKGMPTLLVHRDDSSKIFII